MTAINERSSAAEIDESKEIVITRVFDAPRELVFRAFTDAEHLKRWFSPKTFTTAFAEADARPGGIFRYCMRAPDGKEFWGCGAYRELVEPERIVYVDSFTDPDGNVVDATYYGMGADHPVESLVTITFEEQDGGTKVTLRHALGIHVPERTGAIQGWTEMLEKLAELLTGSGTK